ncbi:FAD dependent oxidoreductase [Flagelloscypha sp. PMI_526]|nr:FAD dependent oxidoreductase [Flagelloscypha sp. PMI_526]
MGLSKFKGLPVENPTRSFWLDSSPDLNPLAEVGSQGVLPTDADVCIIGSGITGVSTAYHLNGQVKVVILEARKFCRNGGHITPYGSRGFAALAAQYGAIEANKTFALEQYTSSEIVSLIHKHGLEEATSLVHGGHNGIFHSADDASLAKIDHEAAKAAGANVSHEVFISEDDMRERYGVPFPGVRVEGHNIWPMKLVTELYKLANSSSLIDLSLHTFTPVVSVTESSSSKHWAAETPRGNVNCNYIVYATNAYTGYLLPQFSGAQAITPTRGQIIAFRANTTIDQISHASWSNWNGYWHPIDQIGKKPLIILGGSRHENDSSSFDDSVLSPGTGKELRKLLPPLFPRIYEGVEEPEMEWTGIMGYTKLMCHFDGRTLRGQYVSAGYTGHGMPRTFSCAQVIAEMVHAEIEGRDWSAPSWLPERFLTWNRFGSVSPVNGSYRSRLY